jgi:hypothetical protein
LTGGYHVAFLIGAGLIVAAIAVAATVLQSERAASRVEAQDGPIEAELAYCEAA